MREVETLSATTIKTLLGLLLITSPATFGLAVVTGAVDDPFTTDAAPEDDYEGEVIETFERSFDDELETGALDLRVDEGAVRVVGWEEDGYRIDVVRETLDGQSTSDTQTDVAFTDESEGSHLNLSLVVDSDSSFSADAGPTHGHVGSHGPAVAIVAFVPSSAAYDSIYACEGEDGWLSETLNDAYESLPLTETDARAARCVPADDEPEVSPSVTVNPDRRAHNLNVTWGAIGLNGGSLEVSADNGDVQLEQLAFDAARITTDNGDVTGTDISAATLEVLTDNGDVSLDGSADTVVAETDNGDLTLRVETETLTATTDNGDLTFRGTATTGEITTDNGDVLVVGALDEGAIETDNGRVTLQLEPRTSGALDVRTDNGDIIAELPAGSTYGYDILGESDNGQVIVAIENGENQRDDVQAAEDENDSGDVDHVRTQGFEERPVQLTIEAVSDNGDVTITDTENSPEHADEEGSDDDQTQRVEGVLAVAGT